MNFYLSAQVAGMSHHVHNQTIPMNRKDILEVFV